MGWCDKEAFQGVKRFLVAKFQTFACRNGMGKNWLIILLSMILFEFSLFSDFFCVATAQRCQLFFVRKYGYVVAYLGHFDWLLAGNLIAIFLLATKLKRAEATLCPLGGARAPVNDKNRKAQWKSCARIWKKNYVWGAPTRKAW